LVVATHERENKPLKSHSPAASPNEIALIWVKCVLVYALIGCTVVRHILCWSILPTQQVSVWKTEFAKYDVNLEQVFGYQSTKVVKGYFGLSFSYDKNKIKNITILIYIFHFQFTISLNFVQQ
jgi:hypothetical protein